MNPQDCRVTIDAIKSDIAYKARQMGLEFDGNEIIDVVDGDQHFVFLRSVKAIRQIERSDGTIVYEKFNDPIIWLDYPPASAMRSEVDQGRQTVNYFIPQPQLRIRYPMLIQSLPRLMRK